MSDAVETLIIGADVGASSTKVAVATPGGRVLAVVRAPGANPNTVGLNEAGRIIRTAVDQAAGRARRAISDRPAEIAAMVVGLAGGARKEANAEFLTAITASGMGERARILSDLAVAFSSATPVEEGYVLIAGTGAVAGEIHGESLVNQRDGWGWLLGDPGSGFWLGREAVRSTLRAFEDGAVRAPLHAAVLAAAGATDRTSLVQTCYARPPIWLASLAGLISVHADDPAARAIADEAAAHLVELVTGLHPRPDRSVVLAGSVANAAGPVGTLLRSRLHDVLPNPLLDASSGLVGALWAAVRSVTPGHHQVHQRLTESLDRYQRSQRSEPSG